MLYWCDNKIIFVCSDKMPKINKIAFENLSINQNYNQFEIN